MSETPDADELHDDAIDLVESADAGFVITVEFGREDNDIDEGDVADARVGFADFEDVTTTELIAARTLINNHLDDVDKIGDAKPDEADAMGAIAVPPQVQELLSQMGSESDTEQDDDQDDPDGTPIGFS